MTGSEDAALRRQASQHLQRRTAALRPLAARRDLVRCSSQALRARQGKSSRGTTEAVTNSGRHAPPASSAAVRCIPDHHPCIHLLAQMPHTCQVAWDVIWNGDRATALAGVSGGRNFPVAAALVRAAFHDAGTYNA